MIPLFNPRICKSGIATIAWSLMQRRLGPGPETKRFEEKLSELFQVPYVTAVPSGTMALFLAIQALKAVNDLPVRSFYPAYGFIAGAEASLCSGNYVTLVDVTKDSLHMSFPDYDKALEFGQPSWVTYIEHNGIPDQKEKFFLSALWNRKTRSILDLACSIGNPHERAPADFYIWSFSVPKLVTTGQGGAIGTNDKDLHAEVRRLYDHGGASWRMTRKHSRLGLNLRFNDILASYGLAQLKQMEWIREQNLEIWNQYDLCFLKPEPVKAGWCYRVWSKRPAVLILKLRAAGIEASQLYPLMTDHPIISGILSEKPYYPNAEYAAAHVVYLPSWIGLKLSQVRYIAEQVQREEQEL